MVAVELAYINTKHPDFTEAHLVHRSLTEGGSGEPRQLTTTGSNLTKTFLERQNEETKVSLEVS